MYYEWCCPAHMNGADPTKSCFAVYGQDRYPVTASESDSAGSGVIPPTDHTPTES